jgi:hypothetical protein
MIAMRPAGIFVERKRLHVESAMCGGPAFEMLTRGPECLKTLEVKLIFYLKVIYDAEINN